jgi:hypothetical protein
MQRGGVGKSHAGNYFVKRAHRPDIFSIDERSRLSRVPGTSWRDPEESGSLFDKCH